MPDDSARLRAELAELIAIPSISADPAHAGDVRAAAEWICERIRGAGGLADLVDWQGSPLAVGEIAASSSAAPTILCYGHFDVQPPDPLELWESDPFRLEERDGWLYARGVADDKGQLIMLLSAAAGLAARGELPVNVRFACDGEEETGGHSIVDWLAQDERGADAALVFDSGMTTPGVPELNVALRGMCYLHLTVRTGERDLHSGLYGGAALNALHALTKGLEAVIADETGRVPEALRAGIVPPHDEEVAGWAALPPGADVLATQGAQPMDAHAADEFYLRTWAEPTVEVNGITGGSPLLQKTVLPVEAQANVSLRLAPGQSPDELATTFERLLRAALPPGADLTVERWSQSEPAYVDPGEPAIELASAALEETMGSRPLLVRSGGSIPVVAALVNRGIPTVVTGFALLGSNIHSPNERLYAPYLAKGVETAEALFRHLGRLG